MPLTLNQIKSIISKVPEEILVDMAANKGVQHTGDINKTAQQLKELADNAPKRTPSQSEFVNELIEL